RGIVERARERFEGGFGPVVVVVASEQPRVQRKTTVGRERLQQVRNHLAAQAADHWAAERQVDGRPGAAAQVDGNVCERFVQGHGSVPEATNATPFAEGLVERLTQADANILSGMVLVYVKIAFGA